MRHAYEERFDAGPDAEPSRDHRSPSAPRAHRSSPRARTLDAPPGAAVAVLDPSRRVRPAPRPTTRGVPRGRRGRPPRRRLGGLDGLRAIAVTAVVAFHLDPDLIGGGFLGVDVFFVISGFLITHLLAVEILTTGRLRLGRFYWRRARRLLPVVAALLLVVVLVSETVWRDQLPTLKGGVLSSLGYVTNWWLIADRQSYFVATGRPTMVQHLWSLAIEEQFLLLWSLLVLLLAGRALARRRGVDPVARLRLVVVVAAGLAVASTLVMTLTAVGQDLPYGASTSRVYFGSDTHSAGLFLGSAAGAWFALWHRSGRAARPARARPSPSRDRDVRPRWRGGSDVLGVAALAALGWVFFALDEYRPGLYRGGFLAVAAVVLVVILCATRAGSLFGRVLDIRPLRWLGQRSYSIYIWHWPVCVVTRPDLDVQGPAPVLNLARLALILGLASLSYRFVESPLRSGQLAGWRREQRTRTARTGRLVSALVALVAAAGLIVAPGPAAVPTSAEATVPGPETVPAASEPEREREPAASPDRPSRKKAKTSASAERKAGAPRPTISAYGDSVLLGAGPTLRRRTPNLALDAEEGRRASAVLADVNRDVSAGVVATDVVVHVGNNGPISPDQLQHTLTALSGARRVLLLTLQVPRGYESGNNELIRSVRGRYANVSVVDWSAISRAHPDWLYPDLIHLTPQGASGYAKLVAASLRAP